MILKDEERTKCEVYSRVMGYHRPIDQWNLGKQQEFADREMYTENAQTLTSSRTNVSDRVKANWGGQEICEVKPAADVA